MGLTVGPVPTRVDARVKAGLLDLVAHAVAQGWSTRRACHLLNVAETRLARWADRWAAAGMDGLVDQAPGGNALHGLLDCERDAILSLFEAWAGFDRSHRKLAARGSRLDLVHVSGSTIRRVLADAGFVMPSPAVESVTLVYEPG